MNTSTYNDLQRFFTHFTRRGPPIRSGIVYEKYVAVCEGKGIDPLSIQMFSVAACRLFGVERIRSGGKSYMCLAVSDRVIQPNERLPDQSPGSYADKARQSHRTEPSIGDLKRAARQRLRDKERAEERKARRRR